MIHKLPLMFLANRIKPNKVIGLTNANGRDRLSAIQHKFEINCIDLY